MEPLIVTVIRHYHPEWEAPPEGRGRWIKCYCPWHQDTLPSASVSYEFNAFKCHACGVRGNYVGIVLREEGVSYAKAKRIAEEISAGSDNALPQEPARFNSRRLFSESGTGGSGVGEVQTGVRGRSTPWS